MEPVVICGICGNELKIYEAKGGKLIVFPCSECLRRAELDSEAKGRMQGIQEMTNEFLNIINKMFAKKD